MKNYILIAICACATFAASAQAKLETKRFRISDLCEKTMEIVLTGNPMVDAAYRNKAQDVWHISPYEFCTREQFEQRKKSKEYYFLVMTESFSGKDSYPGINFLSMYKGDPKAGAGVNGLYKITSVPLCSAGGGDGREATFLPAMLDMVQQQALRILSKEFNIGDVVRVRSRNVLGSWPGKILIADCDLAFEADESLVVSLRNESVEISDPDTACDSFDKRDECLVGYVVAPKTPEKGSVCFTFLINASTYEVHYMHRRTITPTSPAGFTKAELKAFAFHDFE